VRLAWRSAPRQFGVLPVRAAGSVRPARRQRTTKFIDLYKRGCFVLESKKYDDQQAESNELALLVEEPTAGKKNKIIRGTERWDDAMLRAFLQAERYAHHLPNDEPAPVFLIIVDVGHVIELYADFSQKGRNYVAFPDSRSHRIPLADLAKPSHAKPCASSGPIRRSSIRPNGQSRSR